MNKVKTENITVISFDEIEDLKVSSRTETTDLTRSIMCSFRANKGQKISQLGAQAIATAVKAAASASINLKKSPVGIDDLLLRPTWFNSESKNGEAISGITLETVFVIDLSRYES